MVESTWDESTKRKFLLKLLKEIAVKEPENPIEVPEKLQGFGTIEQDINKCILCGACTRVCQDDAMELEKKIDLDRLFKIPQDSTAKNRVELSNLIKKLMKKEPKNEISVPSELKGIGTPKYDLVKCVACKKCVDICEHEVLTLKLLWDLPQILKNMR